LHDDGTNVFTVRQDDLPFTDVGYAFAVEEGTTNLFTNPTFQNGESGFDYVSGWSSRTIKDGGPLGRYIELVDDSTSGGSSYGHTFNVTPEQTYTFSVYINVLERNQDGVIDLYYHWFDANGNIISASTSATLGEERPSNFVGQGWRRYKITDTAPANAARVGAFVYSSAAATSRIQVTGFQFEEKPFATSFTEGTRPAPRLKIPFNYKGDWVLSFWFRPDWEWGTVPVASAPEPTYNLASWGTPGTDGWLFRIDRYNNPGYINLETYAPTVDSFANPADFGLNNRNWAYFVIVSDISNKLFKVYINGQLAISQSNTDWDMPPDDYVSIGTRRFSTLKGAANGLFSNILIARYDPNIWNDEYIRELYNNQVLAKALKQVEKSPTPPQGLKTKYNITHMGELLLQDPDLWKMWFSKANFDKKIVTLGWKWGE
jgi:hypothetical protein